MPALTFDILKQTASRAEAELAAITTAAALEAWRVTYLGRKGILPQLLREVKTLPKAERTTVGQAANELRKKLQDEYDRHRRNLTPTLSSPANSAREGLVEGGSGHLHPLTQSLRSAQEIFSGMGFQFVEGPEIERLEYNFDNLNIGQEHPSRAETDTFYLKDFPDLVLRTHVSTLQSRAVLDNNLQPPFRIFYSGPTFRSEKEDATHGSVFHQYEFMVVDETVNLADLKSIVQTFYSLFFGREMEIRFRPSYFPFVEPGLEVDIRDKVTKKGNWLEMAGAGLVHPQVLRNINIDPTKYQGIALGGGLDRLAMLKYGVPDIRLLYSGNIRFLQQF